MPRVYVAGLFHETHTFLEETTTLGDFEVRRGSGMLACEGDSSPLGGALETLARAGAEVIPGPDYRAIPGGTVSPEVVRSFWEDVVASWSGDADAIFLVLHGAMVSRDCLDVEGEILRRFRALSGGSDCPIFAVYDLHANVSDAMAEGADGLFAYRENPHMDARDAARRSVEGLLRCLGTGERPTVLHRPTGLLWAPAHTGTAEDPMASLQALAREFETSHADFLWGLNVSAGFAYADTPDTGVSFQAVTPFPDQAAPLLDALVSRAHELNGSLPPPDEAVDDVMERVCFGPVSGLTVLVEPSDNIGAGAPGDGTGLLRALLRYRVPRAAVCLWDPGAVTRLGSLPLGGRMELPLGGRGSRFDPGPVSLQVELLSTSAGRFELEDRQSHLASLCGDRFEMGPCAVVRHDGLLILLTSRRTPPFDLGQWRSQGLEPADLGCLVVKAAVAHRRAYDPITARTWRVDTPGPCRTSLSEFPYRWAGRAT